jgi:hypothetical protein
MSECSDTYTKLFFRFRVRSDLANQFRIRPDLDLGLRMAASSDKLKQDITFFFTRSFFY